MTSHGDADRLETIGRLSAQGWFRTSLIRSSRHPVRLYLDQWMRDAAGVYVGEPVRITLAPDEAPREPGMPDPLAEVLASDDQAAAAWEALSPSRRREILSYLGFLKTDAALERNVRKILAELGRPDAR